MILVIRPFGPQDILLVRRLQRVAEPLAVEHYLTHPRTPLSVALSAPLVGMQIATFVLRGVGDADAGSGFVQLVRRSNRPEADLLRIAPGADAARAIWCELLGACGRLACAEGLQRIFVSVPDSMAEQECLRSSGFSPYTREMIYRLSSWTAVPAAPGGFRRQHAGDTWSMQRLYSRGTPRLVQQAEGAESGQVGWPLMSWFDHDRWRGMVWEPDGDVRGVVQLHVGRVGHWMRVIGVHALSQSEASCLVRAGLALLTAATERAGRGLPLYVTVRDYEVGLGGALASQGFEPFTERWRFVKHTMATIRELTALTPGPLDSRVEAPAHSQIHTG